METQLCQNKELTTIPATTNPTSVNDVFNRAKNKILSPQSVPLMMIIASSYTVPAVGSNRVVRSVTGGWEIGAYVRYMSGTLIQAPAAQSNLNLYLFRNTFANRVPGQPLFLTDMNGKIDPNKEFVLNPAAWSDPGPGQWGQSAVYYNDYRARRGPDESMNFGRVFSFKESMSLEVRVEFFNVFNRLVLPSPSSGNAQTPQVKNAQGVPTSGFGFIQTSGGVGNVRTGQFHARFRF